MTLFQRPEGPQDPTVSFPVTRDCTVASPANHGRLVAGIAAGVAGILVVAALALGAPAALAQPGQDGNGVAQIGPGYSDNHAGVTCIQNFLPVNMNESPHGTYGRATYDAVKDFQEDHHLEADGIVGRETAQAMLDAGMPASSERVLPTAHAIVGTAPTPAQPGNTSPGPDSSYPQIPCTMFGTGITYKGVGVQEGTFCVDGNKKGSSLTQLHYHWDYIPQGLCNWWVDFDLTTTTGTKLKHSQGNLVHGCKVSYDGNRKGEGLPWTAEPGGQLCATLWKSGSASPVKVSRVCQAM